MECKFNEAPPSGAQDGPANYQAGTQLLTFDAESKRDKIPNSLYGDAKSKSAKT